MQTRSMARRAAESEPKDNKRKAQADLSSQNAIDTPTRNSKKSKKEDQSEQRAKLKPEKRKNSFTLEAAIRPRKQEQETWYLRALIVEIADPDAGAPPGCVECVNFYKEDVFGRGGENLNHGFSGLPAVYLRPVWTNQKEIANVTGFQLVVTEVENPSMVNLYQGIPGRFVYLVPTFDPSIEDRIIGVQLFRARKYDPFKVGWTHGTPNINGGRGGDVLCLQWDLGDEHEVPGRKFRFRFWRR